MYKIRDKFPFSLLSLCSGIVAFLTILYIGSIAVVMTYAALTIEFSQSVKNDEATVSTLESQYLAEVSHIQSLDYQAIGYVSPSTKLFVSTASITALR